MDADATRSQAPEIHSETTTITPGETFTDEPEQYAIEGQIGAGGMGTVLAARASRLGRPVALKVVNADREDLRRRFEREAQVTAKLQHPAIVPVYGSGRREGMSFYAMKHVTGEPLDRVIAKTTTLNERIALVPKVLAVTEAIAYAHSEKVIHRDLKPANVLVGGFGETVVIDWGLAKDLHASDDVPTVSPYRASGADETKHGKVMGTPAYMPLEQAQGEVVDERADVYALGAILYHTLNGRAPYKRAGEDSVPWETMLARVIAGPPEPLGEDVPPDLRAIVTRAMARDNKDRYPSAGELAEDLRRYQTGQLVGAHRYTTRQLVLRWLRRHRTAVTVAVVAVVVLAVGAIVSVRQIVEQRDAAEEARALAEASRNEALAAKHESDDRRQAAEQLIDFMVFRLRDELAPVGKLSILSGLGEAVVKYYERNGGDLSDHLAQRRRNAALTLLGDVHHDRGELDAALASYRDSLAIKRALVANAPEDPLLRRDISVSQEKIGDVLTEKGDLAGALAAENECVEIRERLQHEKPTNEDANDDLGEAYVHRGLVEMRRGAVKLAETDFRADLKIQDALVAQHADNPQWQRHLAYAHENLAELANARTDWETSLRESKSALAIREHVAAQHPENHRDQLFVGLPHERAGFALMNMQRFEDARVEYHAYAAIEQEALEHEPLNAEFQRDFATALSEEGETVFDLQRYAEALALYARSRTIIDALLARDPDNTEWLDDSAVGYEKAGRVQLAQNDLDGALATFRKELAVDERLLAIQHDNPPRLRATAVTHERLGDTYKKMNRMDQTIAEYREEVTLLARAADLAKTDEMRHDFAWAWMNLGDAQWAAGHREDALASYRTSLPMREPLAAAKDAIPFVRLELAEIYFKVARCLPASDPERKRLRDLAVDITTKVETEVGKDASPDVRGAIDELKGYVK